MDLATSSRPPVRVFSYLSSRFGHHTPARAAPQAPISTGSANRCDQRKGGFRHPPSQQTVPSGLTPLLRRIEAIAILLASFALAAYVVANRQGVEEMLHRIGPFAMPLAVLVFAIVASAPFSVTDALAIMNGVIFGPVWGSVVNAIGLVVAAIIGYVVALRTSSAFDLNGSIARLPRWARHFRIGSPMFLICIRIIPGLGGTIATQTAAALRVPIFRQIYTMCAIAVPICTALAIGGNAVSEYVDAHFVAPSQAFMEKHNIRLPHRSHHPHAAPESSPR